MADDVTKQEIEVLTRQFKEEYDQFSNNERLAEKAKEIADNTGSRIVSLMKKGELSKHKTAYGVVTLAADGVLSLNNHPAKVIKRKIKNEKSH